MDESGILKSLRRRRIFEAGEFWLYLLPLLVFSAVFILYPIVNVFALSFMKNYNALRGSFDGLGFENYAKVYSFLVLNFVFLFLSWLWSF